MAKKTYKDTPETLLSAILAMQDKILSLEDEFRGAELTFDAEMGDGRIISRVNPFVQEYRALIRDYSSALKTYDELKGSNDSAATTQLADLRARFKVIA